MNLIADFKLKKSLGQNLLMDDNISRKIVSFLDLEECKTVIEIGAGAGALTKQLIKIKEINLYAIEKDIMFVNYLKKKFNTLTDRIIHQDFMDLDLYQNKFSPKINLIGNLPYNVSSPIFFKLIKARDILEKGIFMIQRDLAVRILAKPRTKDYSILSVIMQIFFDIELLFNVGNKVFVPKPKVQSAVIAIKENKKKCKFDEVVLINLVKKAFNQRRKKLKNALAGMTKNEQVINLFGQNRAEELEREDFITITNIISNEKDRRK